MPQNSNTNSRSGAQQRWCQWTQQKSFSIGNRSRLNREQKSSSIGEQKSPNRDRIVLNQGTKSSSMEQKSFSFGEQKSSSNGEQKYPHLRNRNQPYPEIDTSNLEQSLEGLYTFRSLFQGDGRLCYKSIHCEQ